MVNENSLQFAKDQTPILSALYIVWHCILFQSGKVLFLPASLTHKHLMEKKHKKQKTLLGLR